MHPSALVLSAARRWPGLLRPAVRAACLSYAASERPPHWLLLALKEELGVRLSRKIKIDGFDIEADPLDGPGLELLHGGFTEPETRALIARHLEPGMTVLDIGAYIGQFSLIASRAMGGSGRIIAFEPTPTVFRQLQRNVAANGCANVSCLHLALSDRAGRAKFYIASGSNDQNSLRPTDASGDVCVEVEMSDLDRIVKQHRLERIDLAKIDVEGNELAVLKGGRDSIARFRPVLVIEISRHQRAYGYTGAAIKALLNEYGYDVFRIAPGDPPYEPQDDEITAAVSHFNIVARPRP